MMVIIAGLNFVDCAPGVGQNTFSDRLDFAGAFRVWAVQGFWFSQAF